MQQPKDKRPSFNINGTYLSVVILLSLLAALVIAGVLVGEIRSGRSDVSLGVLLVGILGLSAVLSVMLIFDVRRQADVADHNSAELRRQNSDLLRANNDLQAQVAGRASELADERTQSKTILQSMSEGVVVLDAERVRYTNRALTRLTGFSGDDLTSKTLDAEDAVPLAAQLAKLRETVSEAIKQGGIWQGAFKLSMKDGKELDVAVIGLPLDAGTAPSGQILLLIRDNSQEKRLQSQRNTFVTNASHEPPTPCQ